MPTLPDLQHGSMPPTPS